MGNFQCRVRIINGLFALSFFWQQQSAGPLQEPQKENASVPV
jgi:hypothetical protein